MKMRLLLVALLTISLEALLLAGPARSLAAGKHPRGPILRVTLSKGRYLVSEPVFATISVINTGDSAIRIRRLYLPFRDLKLFISNSAGKSFPLAYTSTLERDSSLAVQVGPHDSASVVIDLLPLYAQGDKTVRKLHTETLLPPGMYRVRADFKTGIGRRTSPTVSFTVTPPDQEERRIFDMLIGAARLQLSRQPELSAVLLDSIIRSAPRSAYHVAALLQRMYLYEYERKEVFQRASCDAALALVDAHPESEACVSALSYYMIHSDQIGKSREDLRDTMIAILQKFPGTLVAKEAYHALKTLPAPEQ